MLISLLFMPLNDVTTTYPNEPQYKAIASLRSGVNYSYSGDNYEVQKKHHPDVKPLLTADTPEQAYKKAIIVVHDQFGWEVVAADENERRIEAVSTTKIMKYKDDVVIEIRTPEAQSPTQSQTQASPHVRSEIHMRSKSRVGKSDLGANAKRIQEFFKEYLKLK